MKASLPLLIPFLYFACNSSPDPLVIDEAYLTKFDSITNQISSNRAGYIKLVALSEIDEATPNRFGSAKSNEHVITVPETPPLLGYFFCFDDSVHFQTAENIRVATEAGDSIQDMHLALDQYGVSDPLFYGRLKWVVKTFGNYLYLRVWDLENPRIDTFKLYQVYPPNEAFYLWGEYESYKRPKTEVVTTSMPYNDMVEFVGNVTFEYGGESYTLEVEENGFMMFADKTSGLTTYGAARYLYLSEPDDDGNVIVDFNYAYNPPCSFSDYTTCRFPTPSNRLPFAVEAGEKIARK